jgi:hypothetical protein
MLERLSGKLRDGTLAALLCDAGLCTPGGIRDAEDAAVEAAVGSENLAAVRARLPARQE